MKQKIDVLAAFDIEAMNPRPIRFKLIEHGVKTTVSVDRIKRAEWMGAGGVTRIVYDCENVNDGKLIPYKLIYFYRECRWEIEYGTRCSGGNNRFPNN